MVRNNFKSYILQSWVSSVAVKLKVLLKIKRVSRKEEYVNHSKNLNILS